MNTAQHKDFLGTFIADMVLQLLSFVSQNERENIRKRQAEGIAAAKARGVHFGRERMFFAEDHIDTFIKYRRRNISLNTAMQTIGCSKSTFYNLLGELRKTGRVP